MLFVVSAIAEGQILLFSKTEGFRHASIVDGVSMVTSLAADEGLSLVATEDATAFNDANLAAFSVVVWLSTTGDVLSATQESAFQRFIEAGGGWVGIHAAADCEYGWPWYGDLLGNDAWFDSHPAIQQARLTVESYSHPASDSLAKSFLFLDEWYNFQSNPRPLVDVVLTIDETSYDPGAGAMGGDHPIAWWHDSGAGRVFYTTLGHRPQTYTDTGFREHVRGGLLWAAGLLVCKHPASPVIENLSITSEESFSACEVMTVRDLEVFGPAGHAILEAADGVSFEDGFAVGVDGRLTVITGRSIYEAP